MTLSELLDRLELKIAASREERLILIESLQKAQGKEPNRPKSPKRSRTRVKDPAPQPVPQAAATIDKTAPRKRLALGKSLVQLRSRGQSTATQVSPSPESPNEPDEPAPSRLLAFTQHA